MDFWLIFLIVAIVSLLIEMITPTLFCINFAIGGVITAFIATITHNLPLLIILFVTFSLISFIFIKPVLEEHWHRKSDKIGFNSDYIEKVVKTIEPVGCSSGAVTVYDERWEARLANKDAEEIPAGCEVKIVSNDSTTLYVERV